MVLLSWGGIFTAQKDRSGHIDMISDTFQSKRHNLVRLSVRDCLNDIPTECSTHLKKTYFSWVPYFVLAIYFPHLAVEAHSG